MSEAIIPGSPLPGKTLRELRARAHALKPVVWISGNGATETVLREIDRSLRSHELIKIHAAVEGRNDRVALMEEICGAVGASAVQIIGKMLVVHRPNPEMPQTQPVLRKAVPDKRPSKAGSRRAAGKIASGAKRR